MKNLARTVIMEGLGYSRIKDYNGDLEVLKGTLLERIIGLSDNGIHCAREADYFPELTLHGSNNVLNDLNIKERSDKSLFRFKHQIVLDPCVDQAYLVNFIMSLKINTQTHEYVHNHIPIKLVFNESRNDLFILKLAYHAEAKHLTGFFYIDDEVYHEVNECVRLFKENKKRNKPEVKKKSNDDAEKVEMYTKLKAKGKEKEGLDVLKGKITLEKALELLS